ncbi:Arginine/serine-rich splicing factor 35 [Heracleum sosnowskyi]|uniref:Arginine/serine-rich splicing factor 35 n=1 Tax=Heracleum sosnowskyi TaxID=360622 RepID=A0AAD8HHH8_9APIA|nr:Arginine/serine-rich splicing factor 35 [Heracleum sosnowskyi]
MKPIFCGNFDYEARQSDLERLFRRYGRVTRVDMKSGFAFVYMEDERDAEDAIRRLDNIEFGRKGRRLRVEWTKQERSVRKPENSRRSSSNLRPSKTLFVINFDPYHTRTRDLERHFDPYGKILNIRIRRNFAFIQFETQEDAIKALEATNMSKLMDRVISVEYAIKDDDERKSGHSPDRVRDRSPRRRNDDRGRSPSPYRRERGSPDYGHGRGRSPSPYHRERGSPDYGGGDSKSPNGRDMKSDYGRGGSRSPTGGERKSDYGRDHRSPIGREKKIDYGRGGSPDGRERKADYGRGVSPDERVRRTDYGRGGSPDGMERKADYGRGGSPDVRERKADYGRGARPDARERKTDYGRVSSPDVRERKSDYGLANSASPPNGRERISYGRRSSSPEGGELVSPDPVRSSSPRERHTPEYDNGHSPSPKREKWRREPHAGPVNSWSILARVRLLLARVISNLVQA